MDMGKRMVKSVDYKPLLGASKFTAISRPIRIKKTEAYSSLDSITVKYIT
jgi:hypothetical protein